MLSSSEKYELKKKFRHLEAEICKIDNALDNKADLVDGVVPTDQLPITQDIIDALNNANAPTGLNYFTTLADLSSITPGTLINVVTNYAALPAANTVPGEFYWVENSQGTSWLPGPLGGTYYPNGLYYSNGTTWIFTDVPFNATQVEVDAGLNNNKFLTPQTFENAAKWNTKVSSVTGPAVDNTDPLNPVVTIPTNLTFYSTTAAGAVPGYNKLVISLDDPNYDTVAVDIPIGPITGAAQLVGSLVSDAGIFAGNPGTINVTTVGEIRRTSGSGSAEFYFEVYLRDGGGIETLVATSNVTPPITDGTYGEFQASTLLNNGTWAATDRVVIKYYANRIPGGSNPNYNFLFGGNNPVRTLFPISASLLLNVPIAIGVTGVTGGTAGSALTVGPTGLLSQLAFDSTPTNGSLNPVFSDGVYDALQLKQDNITLTTTGTSGAATLVGSTLNIPQYQSVLTNPVTGTGTAGQVSYWTGTNTQGGSNNLFWDAVNGRLGIGTNTPSYTLDIAGSLMVGATHKFIIQSNTIYTPGSTNAYIALSSDRFLNITNGSTTQTIINFDGTTRNVGIGIGYNNAGSARLHVRGSGTTSSTTALLVQNSTPSELFKVFDNGHTSIGPTVTAFETTNCLFINSGQPQINFYRNTNGANQKAFNIFLNFLGDLTFATRIDANTSGTNLFTFNRSGNFSCTSISLLDGNIAFSTTTGTKIGTATTQKLSFWNATPVVQQSGNIVDALSNIGLVATPTLYTSATATLTTAGWTLVGGYYEQDIANANITATSLVNIIPDNDDVQTVIDAEFLPANDSSAGSVKVYSKNLPTADIDVTLIILK